jgi:phosphatidylglycerol lysyltransferase
MVATVDEWEKALEYCRRFGRNSVSSLTLEPDKNLYLSKRIEGVASYCISGRVMLLCGDPICEENNLRFFLQELIDYAKINRYKLMFLFTLAGTVSTYRELGLSPFKIGEEAVIGDVQGWTIAGRKNAKVRSAWYSAENRGLKVKEYSPWISRDLELN